MATFWFQVGTHLKTNKPLQSKEEKKQYGSMCLLEYRLSDSLMTLWERCHKVVVDCPVCASTAFPYPHDHSHSNNLS